MDRVLFVLFAAVAVLSAVLSITRKNAVAAACWLVLMFFGLAGIYVLLEATFVAVVQILVYAGAIMVLFLFVIMLLDLRRDELLAHKGPRLKVLGVLLSLVFFGIVIYAVTDAGASTTAVADRTVAVLTAPGSAPRSIPLVKGSAKVDIAGTPYEIGVLPDGTPFLTDASGSFTSGPQGTAVRLVVQHGGLEPAPAGAVDGSPRAVGMSLFEHWLLPFEVASLLLTGAIFGAVVLTKRRLS